MDDFEEILNEYALAVVERAQSNLRIKRRVRGKMVNRVASGNRYTTKSISATTSPLLTLQ